MMNCRRGSGSSASSGTKAKPASSTASSSTARAGPPQGVRKFCSTILSVRYGLRASEHKANSHGDIPRSGLLGLRLVLRE